MVLEKAFFLREDTLQIAKDLLGKYLYTHIDGCLVGGKIVETEAYIGPLDEGSHAFNNKRTPKNETMYAEGGVIYMYICYGIHDMLNIVTGPQNSSHAILIRAIEPTVGVATMLERRGHVPLSRLAKGPGSLAKALGLNKNHDKTSLIDSLVWIEDNEEEVLPEQIKASARVGLGCKEPYHSIPWRFYIANNAFVSKGPKA